VRATREPKPVQQNLNDDDDGDRLPRYTLIRRFTRTPPSPTPSSMKSVSNKHSAMADVDYPLFMTVMSRNRRGGTKVELIEDDDNLDSDYPHALRFGR